MTTRFLPVLLTALLSALPATAQLEPNSEPDSLGPRGGSAVSVVAHPLDPDEILVIKYTQGVFRSTDGGATFGLQPYGTGYINAEGNERDLTQNPSDPDTLYMMLGNRVFKSTDFGASWNPLSLVALYNNLKSLAVSPSGSELMALDAFNAYHSGDGGASWSLVLEVVPFSGDVLDSVTFAQSDASVVYIGYSNGIFRSDDGGLSFSDTGPFDTWVNDVTTSPTDPDMVYVCTSFGGVLRSVDGGATLTNIGGAAINDINLRWFTWEPDGGLWLAGLTSTNYSADGGDTWVDVTAGFPVLTPIMSTMVVAANGVRLLGAESNSMFGDQVGGGLYRMPAGPPSSWSHVAFLATPIADVAIAGPDGLRILGIGNGIYAGSPGEPPVPTDLFLIDTRAVAVDPDDPTRWIGGGVGSFFDNAQMHVVTGNGANFVRTYERYGSGVVTDVEFDPHFDDRLMAGMFPGGFGQEALILSTNNGDSWAEVPGTAGWATRDVAYDPHTPGRILQLSDNNQWSESVNGGSVWLPLQAAWPGTGPGMLLVFDPILPGRLYRGDTGSGLWRSDDDGDNWISLGVGLTQASHVLCHPDIPGMLWVSDDAGQILVSLDAGASFDVALDIPLGENGSALAIDEASGDMLVGTDGASAWNLTHGSPTVVLGGGSPGTGGIEPRFYPSGSLPSLGNPLFSLTGDKLVGGGTVFLVLGITEVSAPVFGGVFHVGNIVEPIVAFGAGGAAGVPGDGSFTISTPIPNDPILSGLPVIAQLALLDPGAAHPSGKVLSPALRITIVD
ncbi:MAG: hypothetical protein DRQ55_17475 [Planctomycetota bacterium]|nr:MAG: hypothetical protein DRQ55_17475 [Planctomycetota bacterium]